MRLLKKRHKKRLISAEGDKRFWVVGGPVLSNLRDLSAALQSMDHAQFSYHLNESKNDFAHWVADVLGDAACARELLRTKSQKTARGVVERALNRYLL